MTDHDSSPGDVAAVLARLRVAVVVTNGEIVSLNDAATRLFSAPRRMLASDWRRILERTARPDPATREIHHVVGEHATSVAIDHDVIDGREVWTAQPIAGAADARTGISDANVLAAAFDALVDPLIVLDGSYRLLRYNRAAVGLLAGRPPEALLARPFAEVATTAPLASVVRLLDAAVSSDQEIRDAVTDQTWLVRARPVAIGGEPCTVVALRDVTSSIRASRSAHEAESLATLGALVGGVAHEVRNPLFGISAMLDVFELELGKNPEFKQYVGALRTQVERLSTLMQDLLEYGRPNPGERLPTRAEHVIEDAVGTAGQTATKAGVVLDVFVAPDLPMLDGDRRRLAQAVRNVLENAIQHSQRGGQVSLRARPLFERGQESFEVVVRDRGRGFRPGDLDHACDPFFSRRRGGTGLGLAITKRIVSDHGGELSIRNGEDGGAVVVIRLPAAAGA